MKKKTVDKVIKAKVSDWINSIEDEEVKKAIRKDIVVTGGCICSMLLKEKVSDFDVYFKTPETTEMVVKYYLKKFEDNPPPTFKNWDEKVKIYHEAPVPNGDDPKEDGWQLKIVVKSAGVVGENTGKDAKYQYFEGVPIGTGAQDTYIDSSFEGTKWAEQIAENDEAISEKPEEMTKAAGIEDDDKDRYRPVFLSTNAITLSNRIQIITRFIGEPAIIHKYYDYVHCTNYWTPREGVVLNQEALESMLARELRYVGSKYPLCSIIRSRKFINRGWSINAGQYVKMAMQLNELNLLDVQVLQDQLTGVDVAYFIQVIEAIKNKKDLSTAYIIAIIDKLFA